MDLAKALDGVCKHHEQVSCMFAFCCFDFDVVVEEEFSV